MMLKSMLRRDQKGIGAVEFALVAPVFISFIIGISQVGRMFFANADMKSAVAAGARVASVYPTPGDATILAAVNSRLMRTGARARATPTVIHGTDASGNAYVEIKMTYSVPLEFIFFSPPPVTLHDTRRVFTQVASANSTTYTSTTTSGSTTSGGTTSATSASSTTSASTSATSAGGTTSSTGSTSATSAGGTTSSTSATSASSTSASSTSASSTSASSTSASSTSASSTTSASSSSSNGSSGHAHGNCNKKC